MGCMHCGTFLPKLGDFSMPLGRIFLGPVKLHYYLGHITTLLFKSK